MDTETKYIPVEKTFSKEVLNTAKGKDCFETESILKLQKDKLPDVHKMCGEEFEEVIDQEGSYDKKYCEIEDKKLANWKKWIETRKKLHNFFKSNLKREPDSLVMNSEDVYKKQLNKQLIDYATTYIKFDKYRGDPKFWNVPRYLKEKCTKLPINCPVADKFDRLKPDENKPPTLEYIGIPCVIKYEKGFTSQVNATKKRSHTSHKCNYNDNRKIELQYNAKLIEEHKPDLRNLYISGEGLHEEGSQKSKRCTKVGIPLVPRIIIEPVQGDYERKIEYEEMNPMLEINGYHITKNRMRQKKKDTVLTVQFSNCKLNKLYTETVTFENVGNIAIRYTWQKIKPYINPELPLIYTAQLKQRFLFPSNANIFLIGQKSKIQFLFKSRECGVYHEKWILNTDPIFSSKQKILISLEACAKPDRIGADLYKIQSYIQRHQARTCVQNLVNEWVSTSKFKPYIPYKSLFTNRDIFLYNNPDHFYSYDLFNDLFKLYKKVTADDNWDFSIKTIRNKIIGLKSFDEKNDHLKTLYHLSNALLKPNIDIDLENDKYRCVYNLLCTLCNTIEKDACELKISYRLVNPSATQILNGSGTEIVPKRSMSKSTSSLKQQRQSNQKAEGRIRRRSKEKENGSNHSSPSNNISVYFNLESEPGYEKRKCQYLQTLTIKTHQHILSTIDQITAVIESLNLINKK